MNEEKKVQKLSEEELKDVTGGGWLKDKIKESKSNEDCHFKKTHPLWAVSYTADQVNEICENEKNPKTITDSFVEPEIPEGYR